MRNVCDSDLVFELRKAGADNYSVVQQNSHPKEADYVLCTAARSLLFFLSSAFFLYAAEKKLRFRSGSSKRWSVSQSNTWYNVLGSSLHLIVTCRIGILFGVLVIQAIMES